MCLKDVCRERFHGRKNESDRSDLAILSTNYLQSWLLAGVWLISSRRLPDVNAWQVVVRVEGAGKPGASPGYFAGRAPPGHLISSNVHHGTRRHLPCPFTKSLSVGVLDKLSGILPHCRSRVRRFQRLGASTRHANVAFWGEETAGMRSDTWEQSLSD